MMLIGNHLLIERYEELLSVLLIIILACNSIHLIEMFGIVFMPPVT